MVKARLASGNDKITVRSLGSVAPIRVQDLEKGTFDHSKLKNRDLPEQHPMGAITGLVNTLDQLNADIVAENQRALNAEEALQESIPTKVSELENDSSYVTETTLEDYATKNYTDTAVQAEATSRQNADTTLQNSVATKQDKLTSANAGTGISIETINGVTKIRNTQTSAEWGKINGDISQQTDLQEIISQKADASSIPTKVSELTNDEDYQTLTELQSAISTHNTSETAHSSIVDPLKTALTLLQSLIPAQASSENQLADRNFVNSSIATNTATSRGTFNSVEELEAYSGEKDINDYAFVKGADELGNTYYDNYVYNGTSWVYRWRLNNSSFTADQWAAINSNATAESIAKISTNETAINNHIANKSNPHEVTKSQVGLGNVDNTSDLNKPISTATQTALNAKQDTIADLSTIRSGAALGATSVQPETLTTELLKKQDVLTAGTDIEIVKGGSGGILPSGFQQLKYIEGNNNAQYIDTDIVPTSSMNMYVKMQYVSVDASTPTQAAFLMGARDVSGQYGLFLQLASTSVGLDWFTVNSRWSLDHTRTASDVVELKVNSSLAEIWLNGTSVGTHQYTPNDTTQYPLFLNALDNVGETFTNVNAVNRIYRFTIEGLCDMIPAIRQSDSAIGMYDIIRNRFFTNAGTGTFTAGPAKTLPDGYKQVEYIESTGTQYIDTGVIPTLNTKLIVKVTRIAVGGFAGSRDGADANSTMMSFGTNGTSVIVDFNNSQNTPYRVNYDAGAGAVTVIAETSKDARKLYDENGTLLAENTTVCSDTFTATKNMYLFSCNGASISNGCRVFYAKIWDGNTLIRDFVPCLDTNNVACLYDMVGKQTYYNAGTGTFEAGEVIGDGFVINFTNESGFIKSSDLTGYEQTSNKVTSLSSSSTDIEYPSAKCVYDIVGDIESLINAL